MTRAAVETGVTMIRDLVIATILDEKVPATGGRASLSAFTRKRVICSGNYRGLKLKVQAMKVFKWIANSLIRQVVTFDESQFGFVPGRDTTDATFFTHQLQEKYFTVGKQI